jgi:hypothetical protein
MYLIIVYSHWLTFWASLATVITTFGIVPLQAGIFFVAKITPTYEQDFLVSTKFIPASAQADALTLGFAQSVYGILIFNDTLPPFMTHTYTLAPFTALESSARSGTWSGTWTADTTLYTMDLQ